MIIKIQDFRDSGYCVSGIREWFDSRNLDFKRFLREGISKEEILPHADEFVMKTIQRLEKSNG